MAKRFPDYGGGGGPGGFSKRPRGDYDAGGRGGAGGAADPDVLAAVGTLLNAVSNVHGGGNQLASVLSSVLTAVAGSASSGAGFAGSGARSSRPPLQSPTSRSSTSSRRPGKWDTVVIPAACVGWLKGKQGGMIKEIEQRSGASVDIDQASKDQGVCTVVMHGDEEAKRKAYGFVVAEMLKVADQPTSNMDCSSIGVKVSFPIDAKFVGWVKGPKGKVVQDISNKSCTRVDVDQSTVPQGIAVVNIYGTHENVGYAKELVAFELGKVSPEAAAEINAVGMPQTPGSAPASAPRSAYSGGSGGGGGGISAGGAMTLSIPAPYVGWLKGRQGQMIKDIEARSGATVEVDQSSKDSGTCIVYIRGSEDRQKRAYGLVVAEVMKVSDHSGVPLDDDIGTKLEIIIDDKFVGWVKGPKGKVVQDITNRSSTRVDVDQANAAPGQAIIRIYGTHEGVAAAKDLVAFELSKVGPEAAAEISAAQVAAPFSRQGFGAPAPAPSSSYGSHGSHGSRGTGQSGGMYDSLPIPCSYVGWIKGKQGAMVRNIEAQSGAVVDVDQSDKDSGMATVNFRGGEDEKRKAFSLVLAEAIKVSDQHGSAFFDYAPYGCKEEFQLETKYVGWVKGPKGKVVQDISTRTCTRVDTDQSGTEFATVRIFGTHEGVREARELVAKELSKVSPEAAALIAPEGFVLPETIPRAAEVHGVHGTVSSGYTAPAPTFATVMPGYAAATLSQGYAAAQLGQQLGYAAPQMGYATVMPGFASMPNYGNLGAAFGISPLGGLQYAAPAPTVAATDAAALTAALTTALGGAARAPPGMGGQQQAVADLTKLFLQQLATVAPGLLSQPQYG